MTPLKDQAIQTALNGDWEQAIVLNLELLKENSQDIEALNRLAFAYNILGKTKEAKQTYQKVLTLDKQNLIAMKNLKRLGVLSSPSNGHMPTLKSHGVTTFLEESGKTKVVDLVNIAESKVIMHLIAGEVVQLRIKRSKIFILDAKNQYIGMLPDNIGTRLIRFMSTGNQYEAYIKSIEGNHKASIFIRETKRATSLRNVPSFLTTEKPQHEFEKALSQAGKKQKEIAERVYEDDEESA